MGTDARSVPTVARARTADARSIAAGVFAVPSLALVLTAFVLGLRGGGVTPEEWLPVALAASVAVATLAAVGAMPRAPRAAWPALAVLAALVGWQALSLRWSQAPDATVETVARDAMLALAFGIGATCAARGRAALALAVAIAAGGAATSLVVVAQLLAGDGELMLAGRLSYPINYANGAAALLLIAVPPLVALAAAERLRPLARAPLGALAGLVLATGCMAQSRGATLAIAGALALVPLLARDRGRAGLTVLAIVVPTIGALPVLMAGVHASSGDDLRTRGLAAIGVAVAAGLLIGGLALLDRRRLPPFDGRAGRLAAATTVLLVLLGLTLLVARVGDPVTWAGDRWDEFAIASPAPIAADDTTRFATGASNRYDYWRVAGGAFADHPLQGVGAGAFAVPWFRERAVDENVTDAHSWVAGALAETGAVGLLLTVAVLALAFAGAWRARRAPGSWPLATTALGGAAAYYVLHGSVDWLGRIPAVSLPAFAALGALATAGEAPRLTLAGRRTRAVGAVMALAAALLVLPLHIAARTVVHAQERVDAPSAALRDLDRAAELNPWAVEPLIVESTLRAADGDARGAVAAGVEAVARSPDDWTAWAVLAEARQLAGDSAGARAAEERVRALNPRSIERER